MTTIQFRRNTSAEWTADNPVLAEGEPGYETDTGREKRGDGVKTWNQLPYLGLNGTDFSVPVRTVQGDTGDVRLSLGNLDGVNLDIQDIDEFGNVIEPGPTEGEFLGWGPDGVARNIPVNSETLGIDARFEPRDPLSKYRLYGHAVPRGGTVPSDLPDNAWVFDENKPDLALIGDVYRVNSTATTILPTYLDYVNYSVTLSVANTTFQFPAAPTDGAVYVEVTTIQDATGGRTASWPTNVIWDKVGGSNAAPTLESGAGGKNRFRFKSSQGQWECVGRWAYGGAASAGPTPTWVGAVSDVTVEPQDTNFTGTWPAVVNANDVFVGLISVSGSDIAANAQFDWVAMESAGFVKVDGPITNNDTSPSVRAYLIKKKLTGTEDGATFTIQYDPAFGGGNDRGVLVGGVFRGADYDRITSVPSRDVSGDTTLEFPEFTPTSNNTMAAALHVLREGAVITATPNVTMTDSSWTERVDVFAGDPVVANSNIRFHGHMATKGLTGQAGVLQAATSQTSANAATFAGFIALIPPTTV